MSSHFLSGHHASAHFESSHFGREAVIIVPPDFTPEPTFPPGMGRRAAIIREDEEIMAIIVAFLHMKDQ